MYACFQSILRMLSIWKKSENYHIRGEKSSVNSYQHLVLDYYSIFYDEVYFTRYIWHENTRRTHYIYYAIRNLSLIVKRARKAIHA